MMKSSIVFTDNGTTYIYKSWTDQTGIHEVILVENDSNDNNKKISYKRGNSYNKKLVRILAV